MPDHQPTSPTLTLQQIIDKWETMEPRERDAAVIYHVMGLVENGGCYSPHDESSGIVMDVISEPTLPHYTSDIRDAMEVEEKACSTIDGKCAYIAAIIRVVKVAAYPASTSDLYALIHASASARCKAALMAVAESAALRSAPDAEKP